ncbi:(deoxy)nucleoside triphosphate pyrophosphohydrolase [Pseudodesulfovibrio sp. zrk46]|uniref:(deoxy)nucleoside triphosphate pyrophosphohydrolase n=1 Tax=Pseudodesulfovibrio sp. zrk46 TaxID=2725288 RepID=UPI001449F9B0|nr:(deoxy)nucleoside triphosphate pyrophosphohydrolase [Pseudodesulfovibrio sp. zrk46]QJB57997.1 (deoxy)nucleoside triphosphate pyrophosphohydrolase [Pseudodesulfovibrio sp. zrk46]
MKPLIEVVAGIIWQDGQYLAVERPEGAKMAGWWEFPGGKIEPGESRDDAIVRELQEELGVTPVEFEYWRDLKHEYDEFVVQLYFFHISNYTGRLTSLEDQRMEWVDPAKPPTLDYLPADIVIVEALHK